MSVYTHIGHAEIQAFLQDYAIGELVGLEGIAQGITNSNYFLTTTQDRYVLTIFENMAQAELPFFLKLKQHLSFHHVACPTPIARIDGRLDSVLGDKPACVVSCLSGQDTSTPTVRQCFNTGAMLARMHLAGSSFPQTMPNPRDNRWWEAAYQQLQPLLSSADRQLLQQEMTFFNHHPFGELPAGIIHADLFKDNVLLHGDEVAGFIDFYYACSGYFIYDLAIALNDWARQPDNSLNTALRDAFIEGYQSIRPLNTEERASLPVAQRAACIRFWVSRLLDYHFPQAGEMTFTKDPDVFRDLLLTLI